MLMLHYSKMKDILGGAGGRGRGGADDWREESREAGQGNSDIGLSEKTLREEIRRVGKKHRGLEGCRK